MVTDQITLGGILTLAADILAFAAGIFGFIRMHRKQEQIHVLVNSRYEDVLHRVGQLASVLESHGIAIPKDPTNGNST
jgi:hypothetical protein